jgi:hypothetical protein
MHTIIAPFVRCIVWLALSAAPLYVHADDAVSKRGDTIRLKAGQIGSDLARDEFDKLPAHLPVYCITNTAVTARNIEWVLDEIALKPDDRAVAKSNLEMHLATARPQKASFQIGSNGMVILEPDRGVVRVWLNSYCEWSKVGPGSSNILSIDKFQREIHEMCRQFKWLDTAIERAANGNERLQCTDEMIGPRHEAKTLLGSRSVAVYRCIDGYDLLSTGEMPYIKITRLATGEWTEFVAFWPNLVKIHDASVPCRSNEDLKRAILEQPVVVYRDAVPGNTIKVEDADRIEIRRVTVLYAYAQGVKEIQPILALTATVEQAGVSEETILFLRFR